MINHIEEHVRKVLDPSEERVQRAAFPLYDLEDLKHPLVGSCLLLSTRIGVFLLTAEHVLKHHSQRRPLYLPIENDFVPIEGSSSKNSEFDFAFVRLKNHLSERLAGLKTHFVKPSDLDVDDVPRPHSLYGFVGFPETKNRPAVPLILRQSSSVFVVAPTSAKRYQGLGLSCATHFLGDFHIRELVVRLKKGTVTGPEPYGMSGGGVWRMARLRDFVTGATSEKLVGLSIEYRRKEQVLMGVRISLLVGALCAEYLELAKEFEQPGRIRVRVSSAEEQ